MSTVRGEERIFAWAMVAILGGFAGLIAWMQLAPRQFDRITAKALNLFFGSILGAMDSAPDFMWGIAILIFAIVYLFGMIYAIYRILQWIWKLF